MIPLVGYTYAMLYAVPRVHDGSRIPIGVVVFSPTHEFLGIRVVTDEAWLQRRCDNLDVSLLVRYLRSLESIVAGDETAGPLAFWSISERFHWITAHRSDVLQSGPVHEGLSENLELALDTLFRSVGPSH